MSSIKTRLTKLEQAQPAPAVIVAYLEGGIVTEAAKAPEVIGKTEAELDELYNGRDEVLLVKVCYVNIDAPAELEHITTGE